MAIENSKDYTLTGFQVNDLASRVKKNDRAHVPLICTSIDQVFNEGDDLNDYRFLQVGAFRCDMAVITATLVNCPAADAFTMRVYNLNNTVIDIPDPETASRIYRVQEIMEISGAVYRRYARVDTTPGDWRFGEWQTVARLSDIPTVNNAQLTIQNNGTNVATFTANSETNATANIITPVITMQTTDPGEGQPLAANNFIAVY